MSSSLENNSYVLAILGNNTSLIGDDVFYYEFNSKTLKGHGEIFRLFVLKYMIHLNVPADDGYFWGKELADKGVFSIIREDDEAYLFIPRELTEKQSDWLYENKNYLKSFPRLEAGAFLEDGTYKELFCPNPNDFQAKEQLVDEIYKVIDTKSSSKRM